MPDPVDNIEEFKAICTDVLNARNVQQPWDDDEKEAMGLLHEQLDSGKLDPEAIRTKVTLDKQAQERIANFYFMILLNAMIEYNQRHPHSFPPSFKLPSAPIEDDWPKDYTRNSFVQNFKKNESELRYSPIGRAVLDIASGYTTLYESTVGVLQHPTATSSATSFRSEGHATKMSKKSSLYSPKEKLSSRSEGHATKMSKKSPLYSPDEQLGFVAGVCLGLCTSGPSAALNTASVINGSVSDGFMLGMCAKIIGEGLSLLLK